VAQAGWLGRNVSGHLAPFLYSSREPIELLQWLCYNDSTINIAVIIMYPSMTYLCVYYCVVFNL